MIGLTAESEIHAQMEHEIGGQQEALHDLGEKISTLETYRNNEDRPDINRLKSFRDRVLWTGSLIVSLISILFFIIGKLRKIIWAENLKPGLSRAISECLHDGIAAPVKDLDG